MIYSHQQQVIDYIHQKFHPDPHVIAVLLSGSIAHGFNTDKSDVDINIVVSKEEYEQKLANNEHTYWESAEIFYPGGYIDGKYICLDYLKQVAERGNEPTKFALHDSLILFDKAGQVVDLLGRIGVYPEEKIQENTLRFLAQLYAWKWYCDEAINSGNLYLLDTALPKLILFGGRLILLENQVFFPYHKWFTRVLCTVPNKPQGLMECIEQTLLHKSADNINKLFHLFVDFKDWTAGASFSWAALFVRDVETRWMNDAEFIENI